MSCKRFIRTWPPILIITLIAWSYYTYNFEFCLTKVKNYGEKVAYMTIYHFLLLLVLFTLIRMLFSKGNYVPIEFRLSMVEDAKLLEYSDTKRNEILNEIIKKRHLELHTRTQNNYVRYCKICRLIKPDRTHHCSACNICVLRMDHHCFWINNCVGFHNHKIFVLMTFYTALFCFFIIGTILKYCIDFWKNINTSRNHINITIMFVVAFVTGLLLITLTIYQIILIVRNETTLESIHDLVFDKERITFDMGKRYNFTEIFGDNVFLWLIPINTTKGNGYRFNVRNL